MECKRCESEAVIKYGKSDGAQYYLCKDCNYHFQKDKKDRNREIKKEVVKAIDDGMQISEAARHFGFTRKTVRKWRNENYEANLKK